MNSIDVLAPIAGVFLSLSILCAQTPASAQAKKPLDPAVEALLAKMAGKRGVARAGKETTIVMQGTFKVSFEGVGVIAKGKQTELFSGTDLARSTSDVGKSLDCDERGLNGDLAWEVESFGPKVLRRWHAAAARRYFAVMRGDDPRAIYQQVEKTGAQKVDDRECTVLRMAPAEGPPDTWFVAADGTLARIDMGLPAPEAGPDVDDLLVGSFTFTEWQEIGNGHFARTRVMSMGNATVTTTFDKITVGEPIEASKFTPPAAVTKLAKEPPPAEQPGYQVVERAVQLVASIRTKVEATEISKQLGILLPEVGKQVRASGAKVMGVPFARIHAIEDGVVDLEAGIAVQQPIEEKGRVKNSELPGGKCVTCWHVGPYDKLSGARQALAAHLESQKLKARGGTWMVFWTDPGMVPDPAKWKTQLFAPID